MKKHIPNIITLGNLSCGIVALMMACEGCFEQALWFVVGGVLFDFFDGMTARLLGVSSAMGKELDSLADMVTSGMVPGMVAYKMIGGNFAYVGFLITLFSALRLAKFNIDERQHESFIGLATPANALFWLGMAVGFGEMIPVWTLVTLTVLSSWLLVSPVPMFSLKFKEYGLKSRMNVVRYAFLLISLGLLIAFGYRGLPMVIVLYVLISVGRAIYEIKRTPQQN